MITSKNHCPSKTLQMLIADEETSVEEEEENIDHTQLEMVKVSLNSVNALTSPQTMKIRGNIIRTQVFVLINSNPTDNLISKRVVALLELTISITGSIRVRLVNMMMDQILGICIRIILTILKFQVEDDVYPLQL